MTTCRTGFNFSIPVIDVPATSKNLKSLRESRNITVAQIQKLLGMENPQSIYCWENSENKTLPRLDNLVFLAKLYKVSIDELIIVKMETPEDIAVCDPNAPFGIVQDTLDFITQTTSSAVKHAIEKYYGFTFHLMLQTNSPTEIYFNYK